jgi:hypothetical protein
MYVPLPSYIFCLRLGDAAYTATLKFLMRGTAGVCMCVLTSDIFRTHLFTFQMYQQQSRHKDEYFISGHYYCWLAISSRVCVRIYQQIHDQHN